MVSITVSVPEDVREIMNKFPEMNWSGFVRKSIIDKAQNLEKFEAMKKRFIVEEKEITDWSVKLQRTSRSGRLEELKRKGLI